MLFDEAKRFQRKAGKRRKPAEKPDDKHDAHLRADAAELVGQRRDQSDQKRPDYIDRQRAPGEGRAKAVRHPNSHKETCGRSHGPARQHQQESHSSPWPDRKTASTVAWWRLLVRRGKRTTAWSCRASVFLLMVFAH